MMRSIESLLLSAEKLRVIGDWLGGRNDQGELPRAWEPLLFNQTHDLTSGVMVDDVYEDTVKGYSFSRRLGEELVGNGMDSLASRVDTRGEGVPVIVFNALGWKRNRRRSVLAFPITDFRSWLSRIVKAMPCPSNFRK